MPCYGARRARRWVAWRKSYPSPNSSQRRRKTLSTASSLQPTSSHERVTRSLSDAFTGKFYYGYVITYLSSMSVCISLPMSLSLSPSPSPSPQIRGRHGLLAAPAHVRLDPPGALQGRGVSASAGVGPARARTHRRYRRTHVQGGRILYPSGQSRCIAALVDRLFFPSSFVSM